MKKIVLWISLGLLGLVTTACITPKEKNAMQQDIFNAQTRLLKLERSLADTTTESQATDSTAAKRMASTQAELDKIMRELQKIRGEIDTLRIGVVTGQLPGYGESEGSIAMTLQDLSTRVEGMEEKQESLIDAIKKSGVKSKTKTRKKAGNVASLQKAFDQKRFKHVQQDAPKLIKSLSGEDKVQASYLYAESLYKLGKLRDSALKFNDFIDSNPPAQYMAPAKMRMGDCFRHLGDAATARLYYEELIQEFPDTDEAGKAKERLAELSGGTNKRG